MTRKMVSTHPHPVAPYEHCVVCVAPIDDESANGVCDECLGEWGQDMMREAMREAYVTRVEGEGENDDPQVCDM